jgi:hypothetical protein
MKPRKTAHDNHATSCLRGFVTELVRAPAEDRPLHVAGIMTIANPVTLRMLAEELVERLADDDSRAGATGTLVALGPAVLPALESAVLKKAPGRRLVRLAPIFVSIGRRLPEHKRVELQMTLGIAAGLARTLEGRAALDEAVWNLRSPAPEEEEAGWDDSDLPARYGI